MPTHKSQLVNLDKKNAWAELVTLHQTFWYYSCFITVAPKVVPFSAPSNLQQGDRATLTCTVARGDSPLTLMWMKDGEAIPMGESTYKVLNFDEFNSMLTLESLNLEHIGNYSCRASNPAGSSSVETQLIVYGKQIYAKQRF